MFSQRLRSPLMCRSPTAQPWRPATDLFASSRRFCAPMLFPLGSGSRRMLTSHSSLSSSLSNGFNSRGLMLLNMARRQPLLRPHGDRGTFFTNRRRFYNSSSHQWRKARKHPASKGHRHYSSRRTHNIYMERVMRDTRGMWRWLRRQWYSLPQSARQIILTVGTLWFFIQFGGALLTGLFWFGIALCGLYLIRALRSRPTNRSGGPGTPFSPFQVRNSNAAMRPPEALLRHFQKMRSPGYKRGADNFGGLMADSMASVMMNSFKVFDKLTRSIVKTQGDAFIVAKHQLNRPDAKRCLQEILGDEVVLMEPHQFSTIQTGDFDGGDMTFTATGTRAAGHIYMRYANDSDGSGGIRLQTMNIQSPFIQHRVEIPCEKGQVLRADDAPESATVDVVDYEVHDEDGDDGYRGDRGRPYDKNEKMRDRWRRTQRRG